MKAFLNLFLAFISISAICQEVEIINGTEFKIQKKKRVDGFVENNDNMLSVLTYSYKLFETADNRTELIILDENLNFYNQFPVTLPTSDEGKIVFKETKKFNQQLYLISRMYGKGGVFKIFASELDATTGKLTNHYEIFDYNLRDQTPIDHYDIIMSRDSSKMALVIEYRTKNDEQVKTGVRVFNESLETIWEADLILPTNDKSTYITDYMVDNSGNIHLVARISLTKSERNEKETDVRFKYSLFSYFAKDKAIKEYDLFLQNNYLTDLSILQINSNELIGSAFYTSEKSYAGIKGFLNFKLNLETYEITNSKMNDFSEEFLKNFLTERQIDKGRGVRNFRTRYVYPTSNNGYAFIVEEFEYYKHTYTSYNPQTKTTETKTTEKWIFGDVIVFYVNQNGETAEIGILKKRQIATASTSGTTGHGRDGFGTNHPARYWGFSALVKDDEIFIIYNDNNKNLDQTERIYVSNNINKCTTRLAIIGRDSKYSNTSLFKSRDKQAKYKSALIPRFNFTFSSSEQVIVGGRANYLRFMKIRIK